MMLQGRPAPGEDGEAGASCLLPARPRRILVADDEHLAATDIVLTLADLGYTAVPAVDGASAIRLAHAALPDLALLDIEMPECDGLAAAARIFRDLAVPAVIVSAYSDREYVERAREAGVFGYLVKPVAAAQLSVAIDIAWARYGDFMARRGESDDLRRHLEERRLVERAKRVLVSGRGMTEAEAIRALVRRARDARTPLPAAAAEVIASGGDFAPRPPGP